MEALKKKIKKLLPHLNEYQKRIFLAGEAEALGRGGNTIISKLSAVSRPTIIQGRKDLETNKPQTNSPLVRTRSVGGGRKKLTAKDPALLADLESLVEPLTRGEPDSPLRWTCKSTRTLSEELKKKGYNISHTVISELLSELGYSLQSNAKRIEGNQHPDRDAQFNYLNKQTQTHLSKNFPVVSVDTKKKELIGNYKNAGKEYRPHKDPREVEAHDFGKKRAVPYGIYDINKNEALVNVGQSCDTAEFAVESIRRWWKCMGKQKYKTAEKLLITADGGGSNGYRLKLWKLELQRLANETKLEITVCHFPPGTSKWNKIEHRLFSHITMNWKGVPLIDIETVVQLIGAVKTKTGLKVKAKIDENEYERGRIITDEVLKNINIKHHKFHGEWNYTIRPET
jgi:hypothetical protein